MIEALIDPWPPFTFCCPQAIVDQDAGVSIPNLISLLPLDEVPVHVHPFAARAPCDSKGSECQCGIHTAEAASALRSRKTERAAKEKPTPISRFFLAPAAPRHPRFWGQPRNWFWSARSSVPLTPVPLRVSSDHQTFDARRTHEENVRHGVGHQGRWLGLLVHPMACERQAAQRIISLPEQVRRRGFVTNPAR